MGCCCCRARRGGEDEALLGEGRPDDTEEDVAPAPFVFNIPWDEVDAQQRLRVQQQQRQQQQQQQQGQLTMHIPHSQQQGFGEPLTAGDLIDFGDFHTAEEEMQLREAEIEAFIHCLPYTIHSPSEKLPANSPLLKECTICFEEFSFGDELRFLPCVHVYHRKCIDAWLRKALSCPECGSSVLSQDMLSFAMEDYEHPDLRPDSAPGSF